MRAICVRFIAHEVQKFGECNLHSSDIEPLPGCNNPFKRYIFSSCSRNILEVYSPIGH
jgi:hypothetical protein